MVPPTTAKISPTTTYAIAILAPKKDIKINNDAKSTSGEDIRKEKVIPRGSPAELNPINIGILEQLQKGVIVPSKAPSIFPLMPLMFPRSFFVLSGGK